MHVGFHIRAFEPKSDKKLAGRSGSRGLHAPHTAYCSSQSTCCPAAGAERLLDRHNLLACTTGILAQRTIAHLQNAGMRVDELPRRSVRVARASGLHPVILQFLCLQPGPCLCSSPLARSLHPHLSSGTVSCLQHSTLLHSSMCTRCVAGRPCEDGERGGGQGAAGPQRVPLLGCTVSGLGLSPPAVSASLGR